MHVVGLDLTPSSLDEAQLAWLEQDLAAANRNREQVWIKIKTAALRLAESVLACAGWSHNISTRYVRKYEKA